MPYALIIDDEPNIRRMVGALLTAEGFEVRDAADGASGVAAAVQADPDVVLLDLMMPGKMDGMATLQALREKLPDLPVIMMSGRAGLADAVRATQLGAHNFLEKPLTPEGVLLTISSALELRRARREAEALRAELGLSGEMVGTSPAMQRLREMIARVAPTDSRVLVSGESGTGKELVAAAIHAGSARRDGPFVRVNCAALPRDLVESEMFGHERGAFTGASERRIGRFELAHRGTLAARRSRRPRTGSAGQAAARHRSPRDRATRRIETDSCRRPDHRRHEQGTAEGGARRKFSRGPALPTERHSGRSTATAGAPGRHSGAHRTLRVALPGSNGTREP